MLWTKNNDYVMVQVVSDRRSIYLWINIIAIEVGHCNYIQFSMWGYSHLKDLQNLMTVSLKFISTMQIHNTMAPKQTTLQSRELGHSIY